MVAPTKRLDFGGISEGASAAALFDATGGTVSLLAKAAAALREGRGLEVTGAGVSDFGSLTAASTSSESVQFGLVHSGTAPTAATDFMVLRNATAAGLTARLSTTGLLIIADASGTLFTLNGGVALPAGNYWISMAATKGTTTSNGFAAYWLHNADTNVLLESNSNSACNTGTAVFTVVRFGKNSSGGTYTVQGDKCATADGSTALIDLPPVFGTPTDSLGLSDSITAAKVTNAAATDALGLTDTPASAQTMIRAAADSLGLADTDVVETLSVADATTDPLGLTDAATPASTLDRAAADPLGLTDTLITAASVQAATTDALGLSDPTAATFTRPTPEALGLTDSTRVDLAQAVGELANLTDSVSGAQTSAGALTATDLAGTQDVTAVDRTAVLADAEGLSDATISALSVNVAAADAEGLSDATSGALSSVAGEAEGLADVAAVDLAQGFADALGLADSTAQTFDRAAAAGDPGALTDSVSGALVRYVSDTATLADTVALVAAFQLVVADILGLSDLVRPNGSPVLDPILVLTALRSPLELTGARSNLDLMG